PLALASEAEVEGDRVEGVAEVAQPGEEADRAGGTLARRGSDGVPRALVQRPPRIPHEVLAAEAGRRPAAGGEERVGVEHLRQLGEAEVHEEERIAKGVLDRLEAAGADRAR